MGKLIEDPALRDRTQVFMDRSHAGRLLAERLLAYRGQKVHLFAIPAGGVPVAAEIARAPGPPPGPDHRPQNPAPLHHRGRLRGPEPGGGGHLQ